MKTQTIKCQNCESEDWDSYDYNGKLRLECFWCYADIEGNFFIGKDGWVKKKVSA